MTIRVAEHTCLFLHEISCMKSKKMIEKQSDKESNDHETEVNKNLCTYGCCAIKNYVANLRGGLNKQLEKERVLPTTSPRSIASYELSVLCHQIKEDIINSNVDTNIIKLNHRLNGEGGRRHPRIATHHRLNAEFECLQMNET
jgi:hypothetical protein